MPIGAVVVYRGQIIARAHNLREQSHDPTTHAEVLAIQQASQVLANWRLAEAELYVTLEPCLMCCGAMILSRVQKVYYGASDPKGGAAGTLMNVLQDTRLNHQVAIESGVLAKECATLLQAFFQSLRQKRKGQSRKPKQLDQ